MAKRKRVEAVRVKISGKLGKNGGAEAQTDLGVGERLSTSERGYNRGLRREVGRSSRSPGCQLGSGSLSRGKNVGIGARKGGGGKSLTQRRGNGKDPGAVRGMKAVSERRPSQQRSTEGMDMETRKIGGQTGVVRGDPLVHRRVVNVTKATLRTCLPII